MGLYKDFAASALVVILPHLNRGSQDRNIKGMNEFLSCFLKECRLQLHCKRLTLQLIGADNLKSYASGSWSKGADSNVLMRFIPWLMEKLQLDVKSGRPWKYLYGGCMAIQATMDSLCSAGVFLSPDVAIQAGENGYLFLQAYAKMAEYAAEAQRNLCFNMVPKLHYLHHVCHELLGAARYARPLNPLVHATPQCEDFIGRVARLSRRVKASHVHSRVLRRYRAALAEQLGFLQ